MIFKFLTEESGASTMRVGFFLICVGVFEVLNAIVFNIIWNTVHNVTIEWMSIGVFVATGLTPIFTAGGINKNAAKKIEVSAEKDDVDK